MSIRWIAILLAGILAASATPAAEIAAGYGDRWSPKSHAGTAPIHAPEPDDESFVVDTATGLDTGCTYRGVGPLRFSVPVDRFVGEVKSDGTLADPALLVSNKVVSSKARLSMPAYDVDSGAAPVSPAEAEVDRIFFNDHELDKPLTGTNDTWIMNEFEVPIEFVRFPQRGPSGSKPSPALNEIRIEIDTANVDIGEEVWCTAIDWALLKIQAMAPILLVHGTAAGPDTWEELVDDLEAAGAPFEDNIQLTPNGSVAANGRQLAGIVKDQAASFGVKKVHLVVHSKGGLDSRRYLSAHYDPETVRVLSLHTLSTPHHGSILADLSYANRTVEEAESEDPDLMFYLNVDYWLDGRRGPQRPALDDLRTGAAREFNANNSLPQGVRLYTYGADADGNNDGEISGAEAEPLFPDVLGAPSVVYHILRDVSAIQVTRRTRYFGIDEYHEVEATATTTAQDNDLSVTNTSSRYPGEILHIGPLDRNHANMKDGDTARSVLEKIRADFPVR
ncbi:MAG TPA: hypothetical protein VMW27_30625 [Thermoanaerobaculia bacterium]|nr:hypothetical protein [Thermoanaerobaculia bacterium]